MSVTHRSSAARRPDALHPGLRRSPAATVAGAGVPGAVPAVVLAAAAAVLAIGPSGPAAAQSLEELANDAETPGDILTYGMGWGQQRFSPLDQVNVDNVARLVPVWNYSLSDDRGQESHPLVRDGVMYVTTHAATMAIDARTGKQLWKSSFEYPAEVPRVACCGVVNRGLAMHGGKLFRTTLDAHVQALDAATGEELWKSQAIEFNDGYSMTVAPLVTDGVLITGISGGEYGIRGFIDGWDMETGDRLWRTYTVPEPGADGSETWNDDDGDAWQTGGGPAWLTGTHDPELGLVYWGVGNPASWNAGSRPGDNLYTASILALDPKTGEVQWHYQTSPNDPFDHDGTNEPVLATIDVDGESRDVLMQASRNGFFYVLDRKSGELLEANDYVEVNWAEGIDMDTGRPIPTEVVLGARAGEQVRYEPSAFGGKNWSPMSFHPPTTTAFANTLNIAMDYKAVEPQYRAGVFYFGSEFAFVYDDEMRGSLKAIDPLTGDARWEDPVEIPRLAGVMSTGGGLVFTGRQTGEFEAFDAESGDRLWEFQTGSGIVGQPVTWEMDGTQYVSVLSGGGAVYTMFSGDERLSSVPTGGSVWTFALFEE